MSPSVSVLEMGEQPVTPADDSGHQSEQPVTPTNDNGHQSEHQTVPTDDNGHHSEHQTVSTDDNGHRSEQQTCTVASTSQNTSSTGQVTSDLNDTEDDNISVVSLGEARELAQLRIDGIGMLSPENTTDKNAGLLTKKTLPPMDPLYHKKATKALRKAIEHGSQTETSGTGKVIKKKEKKAAKKEQPKLKRSKKMARLNVWLEDTIQSAVSVSLRKTRKDLHGQIAKEHVKIAELYKSISETEAKKAAKKEKVERLMTEMENEGTNCMYKIKKSVKHMKRLDKKVVKLLDEVRMREKNVKRLMPQILEPVEPNAPDLTDKAPLESRRSESNVDSTHLTDSPNEEPRTIIVVPAPVRVQSVKPSTTNRMLVHPPTPKLSVRRFSCKSDESSYGEHRPVRNRLIRGMLAAEKKLTVERPLGAHPHRVRSTRDNVQEYLPYSLQHYDSDDEPGTSRNMTGPSRPDHDGMRKFEESQRSKSSKVSSKGKDRAPVAAIDDMSDDDEFEFVYHTVLGADQVENLDSQV